MSELRSLRHERAGEHQDAACDFAGREHFAEEQASGERAEDGFETHEDSSWTRVGVFLAENLERERNACRHDAAFSSRFSISSRSFLCSDAYCSVSRIS